MFTVLLVCYNIHDASELALLSLQFFLYLISCYNTHDVNELALLMLLRWRVPILALPESVALLVMKRVNKNILVLGKKKNYG